MTGPSFPAQEERTGESGTRSPIRGMSLWPPPRSNRHNGKRSRRGVLVAVVAGVLLLAGTTGAAVLGLEWRSSTVEDGVPESYAGSWRGEMSQRDEAGNHVVDWGAEITLEPGAQRGSAEWFTLNCRGSLKLTERDGQDVVFEYAETYDPEKHCVDESELELRPGDDDSELQARWNAVSHDGTSMISTGTLS